MTSDYGDQTVATALKLGEAEIKRIRRSYSAECIGIMAARILKAMKKELNGGENDK